MAPPVAADDDLAPLPMSRPRRADARRNIESILDAAAAVFAEEPRASMQAVAEAAGVHRATVHRHFPARDDLLAALSSRSIDRTLALVRDPEITGGPVDIALRRLTRAVLAQGDDERLWRVAPPLGGERGPEFREPLVELFDRGRAEGAVRADLRPRIAGAVWGGLLLSQLNLLAQEVVDLDEAVDTVCRLLSPS